MQQDYPTELIEEAKRLTKYILFQPASIGNIKVDSKIFLVFNFNTNNYKKFCKQRGFITPKEIRSYVQGLPYIDCTDSEGNKQICTKIPEVMYVYLSGRY